MLFKPKHMGMWDTWIFSHNDRHYLYWLQASRPGRPWDSLGMAESDDLLHWEEIGTIVEKAADAEDWMGTGRTWRSGDRFIINFSEFRNGIQEIHFAESTDLRNWNRLGPEFTCRPDPRWYTAHLIDSPERWVRWDCLNAVPNPEGGFVGFLSTHGNEGPPGARAVVGMVKSEDGVRWDAAAPASPSGIVPLAEVSGYARFGPRHYVFVSLADLWGPRYDPFSDGAQGWGMWYWMSDRLEGPYRQPEHDHLLHGQRSYSISVHFGTPFKYGDRWLWNHHWTDNTEANWLGSIKELVEESPGHLALHYWDGMEKLKKDLIYDTSNLPPPTPLRAFNLLPSEWKIEKGSLSGRTEKASGLAVIQGDIRHGEGWTLEATIRVGGEGGGGLFFGGSKRGAIWASEKESEAQGIACLFYPAGRVTVGETTMGISSPRLVHDETFSWKVKSDVSHRVRAFVRNDYVEVYLDDVLVRTLRMQADQVFNGSIGLFIDRCEATLTDVKVWRLNL